MREGKKFELDVIFSLFKELGRADLVAKKLGISKSNLSYYTKKLKDLSILKYLGNGEWKIYGDLKPVQNSVGSNSPLVKEFIKKNPKKQVRGHAFVWKIEFGKEFDWKNLLDKSTLKKKYKKQSSGRVLRILFQGRKIWLQDKGRLTIYEPYDYFGVNAYQSKGLAVWNLNLVLNQLLYKLNQRMNGYKFTTSRNHYALIKNELARQFNDRGEKLSIKTEDGTEWMWIDNSKGDGELEVGNLKEGEIEKVSFNLQGFWNENKEDGFQTARPSNLKKEFNEIRGNIEEVTTLIKKSSENQLDSELRFKQMETRLRANEELLYQIINKFHSN